MVSEAKKLKVSSNKLVRRVTILIPFLDALQRKIKQNQSDIGELDKECTRLGQEIDIHRAKLGGVHAAQQNNAAIDKQIRVLENRLEKVLFTINLDGVLILFVSRHL